MRALLGLSSSRKIPPAAASGLGAAGSGVATVGFFDGMHTGHQKVLDDLKTWARETGGLPAVVTFERHPLEILSGRPPPKINTLVQRLLFLSRASVEAAVVVDFNRAVAGWTAEEFIERVIKGALGCANLLMGFDSAFGRGRVGTFEYLLARQSLLGVGVRRAEPFAVAGQRVSSTLVREAVISGDLDRLRLLLGRHHSVAGEVVRGDGRGRALGIPTANLALDGQILPPPGVYAADVGLLNMPARLRGATDPPGVVEIPAADGPRHPAVVNIGRRPTFKSASPGLTFEAHILDWSGDLYGRLIEVHLLRRLRDEVQFRGPDELKAQIARDIEARRAARTPF